jgi:hypothetical protein
LDGEPIRRNRGRLDWSGGGGMSKTEQCGQGNHELEQATEDSIKHAV